MSDALAAALLAQSRRGNPNNALRRYGQMLMQQGASTAPVQHPLEGLSRALTGAVGGYWEGQAEREDRDREKRTLDVLGRAVAAKSPEELQAIFKDAGGGVDMGVIGPTLAMMVGEQQKQQAASRDAGAFRSGYGAVTNPPVAANPTATAGMPPALPQGDAPVAGPGAFANNVGNLRASPAAWQGKGQPHNGFETFATPQAGVNAAFGNLQAYTRQNPGMTVSQAITKWAPPNENDTQTYIRQVSEGTGINPGMPLAEVLADPAMAAQLLDAITRKEKGGLPPGVSADTFMTATGGQPSPVTQAQYRVPQGSDTPRADASGTPLPPSSSVPDVPRPQPSPEQIQKYATMINERGMTAAQARQALDQELTQEWQVQRENRRMQWQQQREDERATRKEDSDLVGRRVDIYEKETRPKAQAAAQEITAIHQVRQLLDSGAFTGMGAGAQSFGSRMAQMFGLDWGADQQANTAALQSAMAQRVLPMVKNLGAGSGISNADREYAEKAAGGNVEVGEKAMRRILDIGERAARNALKAHDGEIQRLMKIPAVTRMGPDYFTLPAAPTYDEWSKANPLPQGDAPAAPQAAPVPAPQAAPGAPSGSLPMPQRGGQVREGATATNPQTGKKIIFRNGTWEPL